MLIERTNCVKDVSLLISVIHPGMGERELELSIKATVIPGKTLSLTGGRVHNS